ncbi:hypothetical protein [Thiolapillus sp.]
MPCDPLPGLSAYLESVDDAGIAALYSAFREQPETSSLLAICDQLFPLLENAMWQDGDLDQAVLKNYQAIVRETDAWLQKQEDDPRHEFVVVIPVADRPRHLLACLRSLEKLRQAFPWGRLSVLVADDSRHAEHILEHQRMLVGFDSPELHCEYFGQDQQRQRLAELDSDCQQALQGVLGDVNARRFWHKGASIMRNISYLELARHKARNSKLLFWFVDSDQEFRATDEYALNYLYHLDRLFARQEINVFTGKVVGDPPVSPAVMAANFLDDVQAFLARLTHVEPNARCSFHGPNVIHANDAAYHDMAELFGFKNEQGHFDYHCPLREAHDHRRCLEEYAAGLNRFFDGEHLTRQTAYEFLPLADTQAPARTVYTGNYVLNRAGLEYFIPFASLGLRMAGPVLGRIIAAEQGNGFLSANLPLLHKRTLAEQGRSEFRSGIEHQGAYSDISGEFERQYYGDVMLFSMIRLVEQGYPGNALSEKEIRDVLEEVEAGMAQRYASKRQDILSRTAALDALVNDPAQWWKEDEDVLVRMRRFLESMNRSFGDQALGVRQMLSPEHRSQRLDSMARALQDYRGERALWRQLLQ